MNPQAFRSYQRVRISTNDPTKIVVMLYEGAVRNLVQAADHFRASRKAEGSDRITKTLDIVHYLTNTLDREKGGEIASNLERLYDFVRDTLAEANIYSDTNRIQTAMGILQTLLEGWQAIATPSSSDTPSAEAPAPEAQASVRVVG